VTAEARTALEAVLADFDRALSRARGGEPGGERADH
jgi:hypothetical protein